MQLTYDTFTSHMQEAADYIRNVIGKKVDVAITLGSELSSFPEAAFLTGCTEIDYNRIPFMPKAHGPESRGKVLVGEIAGKTVLCFNGRFCSYDGYAPPTLTIPPYIAHYLGARVYLFTNAAGGTKRNMEEGSLMLINDHASLVRWNPLYGYESCQLKNEPNYLLEAPTFSDFFSYLKKPDLFQYPSNIRASDVYSPQLQNLARTIAKDKTFVDLSTVTLRERKHVVRIHEGTYVFNSGPNYETYIDTNTIMSLAPGSVGMSSVPEALAARALGMHVLGISIITNRAAGLCTENISHEDIKVVSDALFTTVCTLIETLLAKLDPLRLPFLSPFRPSISNAILIPETESFPGHEAAREILFDLPGLNRARFVMFISTPMFFLRVLGPCLIVSVPLNTPLQKIIAAFEASLQLGISVFLVLDRSLECTGLVRIENVMNFTSVHGACLSELEGQGSAVFNSSAYAYLSTLANNTSLLVTEAIESPTTNRYIDRMITQAGITAATNSFHFGVVAVARALGLKNLFVGNAQDLCSICNDPRFISVLTTSSKLAIKYSTVQKYEFSLFSNVAQLSYEHVERIANELKTYIIANFNLAILIDTIQNVMDLSRYRHLSVSCPLDIYFDVRTNILIFVVPNISNKASLAETTFPARLCKVLEVKRVILITNQTHSKDISCPTDIYNVSGVNSLRGHNDDRWGKRFIDVGAICNKGMCMDLQRLGCRAVIAALTCSPLCVLTTVPYAARRGFITIASACLMSMFELAQARIPAGAIICPDLQRAFNIAHQYLQTIVI